MAKIAIMGFRQWSVPVLEVCRRNAQHPSPAASVSRSRSNTSWMYGTFRLSDTALLPTPSTRS